MVRALRVMTIERGIDPRDFALLAFGGAGPLHAAAIADELGMRRILVPRASGVLSALGLAAADRRATRQRSVLLAGDALTDAALAQAREALLGEGRAILRDAGALPHVAYDVRYRGQSHELTVDGPELHTTADVRAAFEALHEQRYGWREPAGEVELVTLRVAAVAPGEAVDLAGPAQEPLRVTGPAVLHMAETTVAVPAGWSGETDDSGTLVLERGAA